MKNPITYAAVSLLGLLCATARAADAADVEYLSDLLPDRAIAVTQGWGYLGSDTMVSASVVVPRQVTNLGELGLDTKVVASGEPAAKLRIKDKQFARGLGTHANGEILVDLSGRFQTFESEVGVQWMGGTSSGSVVFQVFADGRKLFESGVMRESDPPQPVKVSVQGADELRLVVSDAGDGITADCADWADARLTRNPTAPKTAGTTEPVDVGPFARVLSWDPQAMEGTKAIRSDEFPAADIAPYREILPASEGTYVVPVKDGVGCIGFEWAEDRILRRVEIEFPSEAAVAEAKSVHLQYWSGESSWQGKWQPVKAAAKRIGSRLVWYLDFYEAPLGTPKVRWLFADARQPVAVKRLTAFTRSRWSLADVWIQPARKEPIGKTEIDVYNGEIFSSTAEHRHRCAWEGTTPLRLAVRAAASRPCKADRTVLRFRTPGAAFGVAIEDLLTHDCVYVPKANLFVARDPMPIAPEDYLKKIAGRKSVLEKVRQKADQELSHVCSVVHNPIQDRHNWVPMLISLACDNRKFLVFREGSVVFNEFSGPDDFPGESDGIHTTAANVGQWQFAPSFGGGGPLEVSRRLHGGWLPMPVTTVKDRAVTYQQTTCIAPVGEAPADGPRWLRDRALAAVDYVVKNGGAEAADARIAVRLVPLQDAKKAVVYHELSNGIVASSGDRVLAFFDNGKGALAWKLAPGGVTLSGKLPGGGTDACAVYLPAWKLATNDVAVLSQGAPWAPRVESYWKSVLEPAMQIDVPDQFLGNLIRASQVNCMLAARNQQRSKYVVPWISSVHFAYPESEANSIMRGMDMAGHAEFARRGLEFYLKEANPAGYISILVHNKVAGISSGYTLVGTGEVLWTLGEHYQRTRDQQWLRKVAPEVVHICRWVMRQREKTKLLDARGQKVIEYGLTPPGVTADWNRFAYRFFNEAQWYRGLEMAGRALADVGDAAAPAILADAKEYREDIFRAYRQVQARSPVVPLRNGTWVPCGPSLLNCYGNVEDFLPGEDVNRTYVYTVEVGANHLVANEVLGADSEDANTIVDHLEDDLFLRTNWITNGAGADEFDWGGYAKMQPFYSRVTDIHAMRDDVKPFIRSYFNVIPALLNFEDMTFWEDMISNGYASGAWNKTHETGWFLGQTRTMFVSERGDELWLAPFVTNRWLKNGQKVVVRSVPTRFGTVGYAITSNVARGDIRAVVQLPPNCTAKKIVLRLRHPDGKPMQSVTVQGKPHSDFDAKKETVSLPLGDEEITVEAKY
jgi:hypothetical protein